MANIKNPVTVIQSQKFKQIVDRSITTITADDLAGITIIGVSALYNCTRLISVTLPNNITTISGNAFAYSTALQHVLIGTGLLNIGPSAFNACTSLQDITILTTTPPTLENINSFNNTNNCPIYVPPDSVTAYKAATNWADLASRIQAIPS